MIVRAVILERVDSASQEFHIEIVVKISLVNARNRIYHLKGSAKMGCNA